MRVLCLVTLSIDYKMNFILIDHIFTNTNEENCKSLLVILINPMGHTNIQLIYIISGQE